VIKKFKDGEYNVLVATSIGEEGLDIGEIDMIVCYDAQKTPIRMVGHSSFMQNCPQINLIRTTSAATCGANGSQT
jgi:excinuclease UvrABC helicase subunit UvrB